MKRIGGRKGLGKKAEILIVGSGLAGMSAGRVLSASGYQVTVFDKGFRWRDIRNPAPGIEAVVNRLYFFLTVLGMSGLVIGGVGVSTSVSSYLNLKRGTIATLKTLGSTTNMLSKIYLFQILIMSFLGTTMGATTGSLILQLAESTLIKIFPLLRFF